MKFKYLFLLLLLSLKHGAFSQSKSPFLINNELFELSGKWELLGKIESSGQYSFNSKKHKLSLLISVRKIEKFDFYTTDLNDYDFLNKFYIWESEYWGKDDENIQIEKIEASESDKIIIWRLRIIDKNIESYILSGVRNNKLIGIRLTDNNKKKPRSREEKMDYLKNTYFNK